MTAPTVFIDPSLTQADLSKIGERVIDDWRTRKDRRKDREKEWKEIDRQLNMIPEISHKLLANGRKDRSRAWMPETELPLQAQTLEVLSADCHRLKFPPAGEWFSARAALTSEYLERFESLPSVIPNDVNETGAVMAQDNADVIAAAAVSHFHHQYDFRKHIDLIDADALKYGFGAGRLINVQKRILGTGEANKSSNESIPVLVPRSAKRVYLDDSEHALLHEGFALGPNIIQERFQQFADVVAAAKAGGEDEGWFPSSLARLESRKDGTLHLLELEGDLVVEGSGDAKIYRGIIVTAAIGGTGRNQVSGVVRLRKGEDFSTYFISEYHYEDVLSPGSASPLGKGRPIARAAAQALNRVTESSLLTNQPPIQYDKDDLSFALDGGPTLHPGAQIGSTGDLNVLNDVGGDPAKLFNVYLGLLAQYDNVTGVNAPRLGAQTVSHTTAFAKDVELTRGTIRTVDYVIASLGGPMTRLLEREYLMGRKFYRKPRLIYVDDWREWVKIESGHLPDTVRFRAVGSGQPLEEAQQAQQRLQSAQLALQIDAAAVQLGREPKIDHGKFVDIVLREGGWNDVDVILRESGVPEGTGAGSAVGGFGGQPGVLSAASPALETQ